MCDWGDLCIFEGTTVAGFLFNGTSKHQERERKREKKRENLENSFYCYFKIYVRFWTTMHNGSSNITGHFSYVGQITLQCVLLKLILVYNKKVSHSSKSIGTNQGSQDLLPQSLILTAIFCFFSPDSHFIFQLVTWWFLPYGFSICQDSKI